MTKQI